MVLYGSGGGEEGVVPEVDAGRFGPQDVVGSVGGYWGANAVRMHPANGDLVDEGDESVLVPAVHEERLARPPQRRRKVPQERAPANPAPTATNLAPAGGVAFGRGPFSITPSYPPTARGAEYNLRVDQY